MIGPTSFDCSARAQIAVSFLDRVLPANGWRVAYIVNGEKKFNSFFRTNLELAQALIRWDDSGFVTYHACASFKVNQRNTETRKDVGRTQRNVLAMRCLLGDVDAGPDKPYANATEAAIATAVFCRTVRVPLPLVVASGAGLHIYWPFAQDMDPETWRIYAAGFAALCTQHGFHVDRARTQDLSSVLRTPGTHHRKYGERLVTCSNVAGPFTLEQLEPFRAAGSTIKIHHRSVQPGRNLASDLMGGIYDERPSYADTIADQCQQIGSIRRTPGDVSEPVYHAGIGVLSFSVDGRDRVLGWTDPEWHALVNDKFDRAASLTGPTTCEHFRTINPERCVGCRFSGHIVTPLDLGRTTEKITDAGGYKAIKTTLRIALGDRHGSEPITQAPEDFAYASNGALNLVTENKNGAASYELVCKHPIYLKSVQTGEQDDNFSCLFRAQLPHSGWRSVVLPLGVAAGRDATAELAKKGVVVHHGDAWRKFVKVSVDRWNDERMTERRYDKFGWKDEDTAFLVGTRLYTATGIETVIGSDTVNARSKYFEFPRTRGASFERWQRAANKMFAAGFEHQSLAILASFAAPLMRFHATGEGGAILSFISDGSTTGKTTSLEAAGSVWGDLRGIKLDETDTRVAKGLKLGLLGNLPCTFDELYERDPESIRQFILLFTNGTDKDRGTAEGQLRDNKSDWQTILLLASNKSMIDTLSNHDASNAAATRILELTTDLPPGTDKNDFDAVRRELATNYGYAGHIYMQTLVKPQVTGWIKDNISVWTKQIRTAAGLEEHHRFWTRMAVSIIAAATIVQKIGLLDFSVIRIRDWLIETMRDQRDQIRGNRGGQDAVSVLGRLIHDMRYDTLTVDKSYRPGGTVIVERPPTGRLLCRYETETKRLLITEVEMKKWLVDKSIGIKGFVKTLQERGVIVGEVRKHTLGAGTNFASGQVPCFNINMAHSEITGMVQPSLKIVR